MVLLLKERLQLTTSSDRKPITAEAAGLKPLETLIKMDRSRPRAESKYPSHLHRVHCAISP